MSSNQRRLLYIDGLLYINLEQQTVKGIFRLMHLVMGKIMSARQSDLPDDSLHVQTERQALCLIPYMDTAIGHDKTYHCLHGRHWED